MVSYINIDMSGRRFNTFCGVAKCSYLQHMIIQDPSQFRALLARSILQPVRKEIRIDGYHLAGVLVPLFIGPGTVEVVLTKRTEDVETHKGQISFPGGMVEEADGDIQTTALREAEEELAIPFSSVEMVGLLDDLATPTGFIITPVVGILKSGTHFVPNPLEVAEVFSVPLGFFADPAKGRSERRIIQGSEREIWYYEHGHHVIWGATAMIIRSLLQRIGEL